MWIGASRIPLDSDIFVWESNKHQLAGFVNWSPGFFIVFLSFLSFCVAVFLFFPPFLSFCISLFLVFLCRYTFLSILPSFWVFVSPSLRVCVSVSLTICHSAHPFKPVSLSFCLSDSLFICPPTIVSFSIYVIMSFCWSVIIMQCLPNWYSVYVYFLWQANLTTILAAKTAFTCGRA
jgi:hypothetical protein